MLKDAHHINYVYKPTCNIRSDSDGSIDGDGYQRRNLLVNLPNMLFTPCFSVKKSIYGPISDRLSSLFWKNVKNIGQHIWQKKSTKHAVIF